jgi:hypothetical protein
VREVAAASKAVSRTGARRALRSFVRVGEWDFSVDVGILGEGGGIVISDLFWGRLEVMMRGIWYSSGVLEGD